MIILADSKAKVANTPEVRNKLRIQNWEIAPQKQEGGALYEQVQGTT